MLHESVYELCEKTFSFKNSNYRSIVKFELKIYILTNI